MLYCDDYISDIAQLYSKVVIQETMALAMYKICQVANKSIERNKVYLQIIFINAEYCCHGPEFSIRYTKTRIPKVQNNSNYGYAKMIEKLKAGFDPALIEYPGYKSDALIVAKHLEV
jgi:hypothetical protein